MPAPTTVTLAGVLVRLVGVHRARIVARARPGRSSPGWPGASSTWRTCRARRARSPPRPRGPLDARRRGGSRPSRCGRAARRRARESRPRSGGSDPARTPGAAERATPHCLPHREPRERGRQAVPVALGAHHAAAGSRAACLPHTAAGSASAAEDRDLTGLEATPPQRHIGDEAGEAAADDRERSAHRDSLHRARQQALHEVALEGEEHRQRDRSSERNEAGRDQVDVRAELAQLRVDRDRDRLRVCGRSVSATSRSFHVHRNWKIASDAIAGRPSGRISRRKIRISEAPSMRADSRMSFGIPMKKLRSRKIANGSPKAVWKRIRPRTVSNRCRACCRARRSGSAPSAAARPAGR